VIIRWIIDGRGNSVCAAENQLFLQAGTGIVLPCPYSCANVIAARHLYVEYDSVRKDIVFSVIEVGVH
jgi:hypothetical protein